MEVCSFRGRRGVSLPFSDYCNPIIGSTDPQELLNSAIEFGKKAKWRYLDIHGGEELFQGANPSTKYYGHLLELESDPNQIFLKFRDSTRRNIRKAARSDLTIQMSNSLLSMRQFHHLHCLTRKRHNLPSQPFYFFNKIHKNILSKNLGFIFKASFQNKIIGASVFFHFGEKVIFKFGASDIKYQHLRMNNLIMWEAIKWYADNGYESLFFGRTNIGQEGLRRFKSGWSAREYVMKYFKYDLADDSIIISKDNFNSVIQLVFSKMPISASRVLGALLYKYFG
ncbi:MAG: GNAT family N-acetyltransferase [Desulfobacterales bacterium]